MPVSDRLAHAKARLEEYYKAEMAALSGQSYKIGTRELSRANIKLIQDQINYLEKYVEELQAQANGKGLRKTVRIIPRDL